MAQEKQEVNETCKFLEFPVCVMRQLFSYLDSTSLYQLSRTCQYLQDFIEDPVFWKYVDARGNPNSTEKVDYCFDRLHKNTTHALFRAKNKTCGQVPTKLFENLSVSLYGNLKVLALENQKFCGCWFTMNDFPPLLEEISLKKSYVEKSEKFFQHSHRNTRKLRVLILDHCKWVTCSFLISVAKYENLEIISVVKCFKLHLDMVAYFTTARFGCKKLKIFDCRFSGVGHELLRCFFPKEPVQSLYFQSLKSAEFDYDQNIFNKSYMRAIPFATNSTHMDGNVSDESLHEFVHAMASDTDIVWPKSLLYQDPYPECTCGYKDDAGPSEPPEKLTEEEYFVYYPPHRKLKFFCKVHSSVVKQLPYVFSVMQEDMDGIDDDESDTSGSDNESCCIYGTSNRMILLTPGHDNEPIRERIIELNNYPYDPNANTSRDSQVVPSTSREVREERRLVRSVSENNLNQNLENSRNGAKRRRCDRDTHNLIRQSKRFKVSNDSEVQRLNDETQEARVKELVESAESMGNRVNQFLNSSMGALGRRSAESSRQDARPSTSRAHSHTHAHNSQNAGARSNIYFIVPPKNDPSREIIYGAVDEGPHELWEGQQRNRFINPLFVPLRENKKELNLRRLSLRGFRKITNIGLDTLKNLNINLLDLTYTNVTKEGIESFLVHNPSCRIIHPLYCVCKPRNPFE